MGFPKDADYRNALGEWLRAQFPADSELDIVLGKAKEEHQELFHEMMWQLVKHHGDEFCSDRFCDDMWSYFGIGNQGLGPHLDEALVKANAIIDFLKWAIGAKLLCRVDEDQL